MFFTKAQAFYYDHYRDRQQSIRKPENPIFHNSAPRGRRLPAAAPQWRTPLVRSRGLACRLLVGPTSFTRRTMPVALAGRSPSTFEIKSASLPLLALRLKSSDLDALAQELHAHYGEMPDFFANDLLVVDLSTLPAEAGETPIDFQRLTTLLRAHRLNPIGVRAGSAAQMAAAAAAGLSDAPDMRLPKTAPEKSPAAVVEADVPIPGALVIDKPLRSGQQVYARGRDLVLRAMVNPGAEVIADGHIHVYAPLRGRAIAGARGWAQACIFARAMQPELVSVAGVYRTSDEPLPASVWGHAATVSLRSTEAGDKLIFEPIAD